MSAWHGTIDEHDLLAFVEGTLDGAREEKLRRVLSLDPALIGELEQMRRDRQALSRGDVVRVPAGLVEGAIERLEREALVGGAGVARGRFIAMAGSSGGRRERLSVLTIVGSGLIAAAVLVTLGVGAWAVGVHLGGGPAVRDVGFLPPEQGSVEFAASGESGPAATTPAPVSVESDPAYTKQTIRRMVSQGQLIPVAISGARAAELAREGRLLIRVRARDPIDAAERIAELAARDPSMSVRFRAVSAGDGADWNAMTELVGRGTSGSGADGARLVRLYAKARSEQETGILDAVGPGAPWRANRPASSVSRPVRFEEPLRVGGVEARFFAVGTRADAKGLTLARSGLASGLGSSAFVEFDELAEPVELSGDADASAIVWWEGGSSAWVRRVSVPVVVEYTPGR